MSNLSNIAVERAVQLDSLVARIIAAITLPGSILSIVAEATEIESKLDSYQGVDLLKEALLSFDQRFGEHCNLAIAASKNIHSIELHQDTIQSFLEHFVPFLELSSVESPDSSGEALKKIQWKEGVEAKREAQWAAWYQSKQAKTHQDRLLHADAASSGLAEHVRAGRDLSVTHWLEDSELRSAIRHLNLKIQVAAMDLRDIGHRLHQERVQHEHTDKPPVAYKIHFILSDAGVEASKFQGSHWTRATVLVDPIENKIELNYEDSRILTVLEIERLTKFFIDALRYKESSELIPVRAAAGAGVDHAPVSTPSSSTVAAAGAGAAAPALEIFEAFPNTELTVGCVGTGKQRGEGWTCGYRALAKTLEELKVTHPIASWTEDDSIDELREAVFKLVLEASGLPYEPRHSPADSVTSEGEGLLLAFNFAELEALILNAVDRELLEPGLMRNTLRVHGISPLQFVQIARKKTDTMLLDLTKRVDTGGQKNKLTQEALLELFKLPVSALEFPSLLRKWIGKYEALTSDPMLLDAIALNKIDLILREILDEAVVESAKALASTSQSRPITKEEEAENELKIIILNSVATECIEPGVMRITLEAYKIDPWMFLRVAGEKIENTNSDLINRINAGAQKNKLIKETLAELLELGDIINDSKNADLVKKWIKKQETLTPHPMLDELIANVKIGLVLGEIYKENHAKNARAFRSIHSHPLSKRNEGVEFEMIDLGAVPRAEPNSKRPRTQRKLGPQVLLPPVYILPPSAGPSHAKLADRSTAIVGAGAAKGAQSFLCPPADPFPDDLWRRVLARKAAQQVADTASTPRSLAKAKLAENNKALAEAYDRLNVAYTDCKASGELSFDSVFILLTKMTETYECMSRYKLNCSLEIFSMLMILFKEIKSFARASGAIEASILDEILAQSSADDLETSSLSR